MHFVYELTPNHATRSCFCLLRGRPVFLDPVQGPGQGWSPRDVSAEDESGSLVARVRRGDAGAADELAARMSCVPAFVRVYNRRLGGVLRHDELEDVAQTVMTAIWTKLDRYDDAHAFEGWAFGFCAREVLNTIRRNRRGAVVTTDDVEWAPADPGPEDVPGNELEAVLEAVVELGPPASEIIEMKHFEEASFPEVAGRLHMPLGSVKTHYYRAIAKLRVRLGPLWRELR